MLDLEIPIFIKPMKFVRFRMGHQCQVQLLNHSCTTTITTRPSINDQGTKLFGNFTTSVENIFPLIIERKVLMAIEKPLNHQKEPSLAYA